MDKVYVGARYLLGLILVVFGLNGFLNFIPIPAPADPMKLFMMALFATGYLMPIVKFIEIAVGICLLANKFVPLSLVILAPITINIFLVHAFLDPGGLAMGVVIAICQILVMKQNWSVYAPLFKAN